jgi:hypothetical protein
MTNILLETTPISSIITTGATINEKFPSSDGLGALGIPGVSGMTNSVCTDFTNQLDKISTGLSGAEAAVNGPLGLLKSGLGNLENEAATPINEIDDATNLIEDTMSSSIPPVPDTSDIDNILQNCGLLKSNLLDGLMSIEELVSDFINVITDLLGKALNGILDGLSALIEGPIAFLINEINSILKSLGIADLLSNFDGLFNCIEAICGRNFDVPSIPDLNSSSFPTVAGYESLKDLAGYPDLSAMTADEDFKKIYDKFEDLTTKKLPDVTSFEIFEFPEFADVSDIPGYPYITDMVKDSTFSSALTKIKTSLSTGILVEDLLPIVKTDEFPGIENVPGYPDIPVMLETPAFAVAYEEAKPLAQDSQDPYIEYLDDSIKYVNATLKNMYLTDDGTFDVATLLDESNVPNDIKENITSLSETVETQLAEADVAIEESSEGLATVLESVINPPIIQTNEPGYFA